MSKSEGATNERSQLQKVASQRQQQEKPRRKPDRRIRRTCERLGSTLVALIQEKPIDDVTVQEVLDRAAVGRSTFYLHYRDKDDLLLSQFEKFLETMSTALSIRKEESHRIVPVAELFAHIGSQKKLYRTLADSGRLNDFFDLAQGYFARGVERRLRESKRLSTFRNLNWLLAPLRWPGACCPCCDGGLMRRERITTCYGRAVPPDGVERTPIAPYDATVRCALSPCHGFR